MCPRRDMITVECLSIPQLSYRDASTEGPKHVGVIDQ